MKKKISAVMVVKNEEQYIGECLERIKWLDEIVILDNGSTDKTIEIAKKYTKNIFIDTSAFSDLLYNKSIQRAHGEWILLIDADELISPALAREIKKTIMGEDAAEGYYIPFKHHFLGKWLRYGGCYPSYLPRLAKREKASMQAVIHTPLFVEGRLGYLKNEIIHLGDKNVYHRVEKTNKYTALQAEQRYKEKRKSILFLVLQLSMLPILRFIKMYFVKRGFLDGILGLIRAQLYMYTWFLVYMKEIELTNAQNKKIIQNNFNGQSL